MLRSNPLPVKIFDETVALGIVSTLKFEGVGVVATVVETDATITIGGGGGGDMAKATYDPNNDGVIAKAQLDADLANTSGTNTGDQTLSGLGGIAHSLATAVNDFLVASGAGVFVKKTLAEAKAILDWAADIAIHAALATGIHGVGASTVESATGSQAKVDAHKDLATGVHGAGASTIETIAGSQGKVDTHTGAADPHTGYQKESEKGVASGYAGLGAGGLVPMAQLATGVADGTKFIRDDGTLVVPGGGAVALTDLTDVTITAPAAGEVLRKGAGDWVNAQLAHTDLGSVTADQHHAQAHTDAQHTDGANEKTANKGAVSGYASLDAGVLVPVAQMGTGAPSGAKFLRDDRIWALPPGAGPATGVATLDFGAFPGQSDASVAVVGQAGIVAGSIVNAWIRPVATADHSPDEHMVEQLKVFAAAIIAATGFTIYGFNTNQINEPLEDKKADSRRLSALPVLSGSVPSVGGRGTRIYGQWTCAWSWQ